MKYRHFIATVCLSILSITSNAAVVFQNQDILRDGLSTLQDERAAWSSGLSSLVTEGFEDSFDVSNSIDFGSFTVSITNSDFIRFNSNRLTRTEGVSGIGFAGNAILTFEFLDNISSFGIDWSSIDFSATVIDYSDDQGNLVSNVAPHVGRAGAGFFGITGINSSSISFDITSAETLEFDFIQFEPAQAAMVPTPGVFIMMIFGLVVMFGKKKFTLATS